MKRLLHVLSALFVHHTVNGNPFQGVDFVLDADYVHEAQSSIEKVGGKTSKMWVLQLPLPHFLSQPCLIPPPVHRDTSRADRCPPMRSGKVLSPAAGIPTALWLDKIDVLDKLTDTLQRAREQQASTGRPAVVVAVIYNLPGRDCGAQSSEGEIQAGELERYTDEYLMPISLLASEYSEVRTLGVPSFAGRAAENRVDPRLLPCSGPKGVLVGAGLSSESGDKCECTQVQRSC
jgi:hypothetical protein